jgi:hypothetical protein
LGPTPIPKSPIPNPQLQNTMKTIKKNLKLKK